MYIVIPRDTTIPCIKKFYIFYWKGLPKWIYFKNLSYYGERLLAKSNKKLKELKIKKPSMQKGNVKIDIIFVLYDINTLKVKKM